MGHPDDVADPRQHGSAPRACARSFKATRGESRRSKPARRGESGARDAAPGANRREPAAPADPDPDPAVPIRRRVRSSAAPGPGDVVDESPTCASVTNPSLWGTAAPHAPRMLPRPAHRHHPRPADRHCEATVDRYWAFSSAARCGATGVAGGARRVARRDGRVVCGKLRSPPPAGGQPPLPRPGSHSPSQRPGEAVVRR